MKIAVIGTGYVGLVSGVCFSELGNEVICVDNNPLKVEMLERGEVPIYEPGLKELIEKNKTAGRLSFTFDTAFAVQNSDIILLAVGTPSLPNGEANLSYIEQAAKEVGQSINGKKIVATKSTVPVGTNEHIRQIVGQYSKFPFAIASIPEFLREGSAIHDTLNPDRIILGSDDEETLETLKELHKQLTSNIITTDIRSAEMIKYASNAFLATKISFINEIANICEKVGADVTRVAEGMGYDKRIGSSFLQAGIGYGGSCFPKDTQALIQIAGNVDYEFKLLKSVVEVNKDQRFNIIRKLHDALGSLNGKSIAIWGLAFKPNTDDIRDAPAIEIIQELIKLGARVKAYDPVATANFQREINHGSIHWCSTSFEAAEDSDALCLLTEWSEFAQIDLQLLATHMSRPVLIDGRNLYDPAKIKEANFIYYSVGRPQSINLSDSYTEAMS
ncbi:UDP-glucose dehydrogenase family protein [Paenibacillus provencensis]|uniref:UDP-glucose 6-dehydrogenase n=1 Tax=Paenibacillus provencensis TaxID=441151 RepID=A0ABW3Q8V7_9BACL|nr:UDP-glucose/GDP-mannose dehydrogenase family protein [Paenibacillus sp. MER 78]MCM3127709.1 UDP-glucose/GDP-mannose dehydrogenase family protein [Paenibacillus sp. MER 78]